MEARKQLKTENYGAHFDYDDVFDKILDLNEAFKEANKEHKRKTTQIMDAKTIANLAPDSPLLKGRAAESSDSEEDPVVA